MGAITTIEWTDTTWNPVTGCTKVSPGCKHCYAERLAGRFKHQYPNGFGEVQLHHDRLNIPRNWRQPRKIFVCSMSDLFHNDVPDSFLERVFYIMAKGAGHHIYQVLTKRPERMKDFVRWWIWNHNRGQRIRNVWFGTSVEDQKRKDRIYHLRATPAVVRFLSCEPLLEDLGDLELVDPYCDPAYKLHWIIAGGESGPKARPLELDWLRSIRDQCQEVKVPFFLKQLGGARNKLGGDKAVLDGQLWRQFPEVSRI